VSIKQRSVDFAAVDVPLDAAELKRSNLVQFPILVGGIVVAVNLPGVKSEQLRLSGAVLADIFSGAIKTWNDPAVASLNPHVTLPSAAIAAGTKWNSADGFNTSLDNTASAQAYPIVTAVYVLIPSNTPGRRSDAVLDLFEWALEKGQSSATALGYVPLPDFLVKRIESHWALTLRK
jgi:ABC-type phosphate transport system substrate-binding protein